MKFRNEIKSMSRIDLVMMEFVMKLIQVLKAEAQKDPLILFIRNVEKSILGNFERYMKLETLKDVRLVVIGSHSSDQQKEKVRNELCSVICDSYTLIGLCHYV